MKKFTRNKDCNYKYVYEDIFRDIATGKVDAIQTYRELVKNDLWFIVNFVMDVPGCNRPFIVERCKEHDDEENEGDTLDFWARFHYKSTIITKAKTIKRILKYPERCTGIFSHTKPIAKGFLRPIKLTLQHNQMLKEWFPDVLYANPETQADKWSEDDGIIVKRRGKARSESTVEACGLVEGMPTGKHYDYMILDDVETKDTVATPEMVKKAQDAVDLAMNLGTEYGVKEFVGTPYSHMGVYFPFLVNKKKVNDEPKYKLRRHPVEDENGNPALLSREQIDEIKHSTDEYIYNCQQMIDPTPEGSRTLDSTMVKDIEANKIPRDVWNFMVIDGAGEGDGKQTDSWAMGVFGVKPKIDELGQSEIYVKDLLISPMRTDAAINSIVQMYLRNGIIMRLGVEKSGQSTAEIHIANALRAKGRRIDVKDKTLVLLKPMGRKKKGVNGRIDQSLAWPVNNGKWHLSDAIHDEYKSRLRMEMDKHPHWHDDGLDICAYLYDMIKDYKFMPNYFEHKKSTPQVAKSYAVRA